LGALIPQPSLGALNRRTRNRLAPESARIDLVTPTFSDPTNITNPLFPISELPSALLLGDLHGKPWRAETNLLPGTRPVDWNGQTIETLRSQFVAYLDGRIFEVAVDLYAQADDGSVWYFGEDAFTYRHGAAVDTEGTWLAGVTGPPAMIMPGHPRVGDVYRTENIPGLVFEQVTVKGVDETVQGPTGPVPGAMVAQELHMDEVRLEDKYFAPGYGEFFSGGGRTFEATALAIPADAADGPEPPELASFSDGAVGALDAATSSAWSAASRAVEGMTSAWNALRGSGVPERLATEMHDGLDALKQAVGARDAPKAARAAVASATASLDLAMRWRNQDDVTLGRFALWCRALEADAAFGDTANVNGDVRVLEWMRQRLALEAETAAIVEGDLRFLAAAAEARELAAVKDMAIRLRVELERLAA
jgi:hypothetical protein